MSEGLREQLGAEMPPVLEHAMFIGMSTEDNPDGTVTTILWFIGYREGQVRVEVTCTGVQFEYTVWPHGLNGASLTFRGEHGDPDLDRPVFDDDD